MFHKYPYTDFHELNLDYIMKLARESLGIHLEVVGDKLQLKNAAGDVISNITISYATKASKDEDGKDIEAYIYDAGVDGRRAIVFTRGNNDTEVIPFPDDAVTDKNGKDITSYVANVSFSGENLVVTYGDNTSYSFKCPYALKAQKDANGKDIETYMATVTVVGNALVFKDGAGVTLAEITVPYATTAGEAEVAEKARKDINGNPFVSDYGRNLIVDGNKIGIEAHDGTDLNKITVPFASLSTNATNAIQTVTISGNNIIFTTYGGAQTSIQAPYAVKAQKDDLNNTIKSTYVANVVNDSVTGEISFLDAQGHEIVSIIPTVDSAVHDSLGNDITDYIKSILTSPNSNFVTVTHGDNTVDTLTINYSTIAWKDTYGNAIGNTYCSLLTMGVDPQDGAPIVIGWNGETPKAEIFRLKVQAVSAEKDWLGNVIHQYYAHSLIMRDTAIDILDATGTPLDSIDLNKQLCLENLTLVGNAIGETNADLFHWKRIDELTGEWEALHFPYISDGDVITWDATNNTWTAEAPAAGGSVIDNIVTGGPNGEVSQMDIDSQTYTFYTGSGIDELVDLDDVNVSSPSDGQVLKYDGTSQKWVNGSAGGGGGSSALVVTLTAATGTTTIDLNAMTAQMSVQVTVDKSYAEIKSADDIVFNIVDTIQGGSKYTLKPTGMRTLNVAADQSLFYTLSVITANGNLKIFKLEITPWSNYTTLNCVN